MENNRQLRSWVFMLYPDNPKHENAINFMDLLDNSLYIKHIQKYNDDGSIKNKEHYHCIMTFEKPYWLSTLLTDLALTEEDAHLFHSYQDFKIGKHNRFKSLDDYIDYLDHVKDDSKEDKYNIEDFHGGLINRAIKVISDRDKEKYMALQELIEFIEKYDLDNFPESMRMQFKDWYKVCCEAGYGSLFYKEWYKMRDILRPYINI